VLKNCTLQITPYLAKRKLKLFHEESLCALKHALALRLRHCKQKIKHKQINNMQTKNKPKIQTAMHSISITESQGVSRVHNQGSMACNGATNI